MYLNNVAIVINKAVDIPVKVRQALFDFNIVHTLAETTKAEYFFYCGIEWDEVLNPHTTGIIMPYLRTLEPSLFVMARIGNELEDLEILGQGEEYDIGIHRLITFPHDVHYRK